MTQDWTQIGTVEILQLRIYPIDPLVGRAPPSTDVAVDRGVYPVYRKGEVTRWVMRGRISERGEKIGDGLYLLTDGDKADGLEVQFPSRSYGPDEFSEFLTADICLPGPSQRLRFTLEVTA